MSRIDQFESVFKAASRPRFLYERPVIERVLIFTDLDEYATALLEGEVKRFLAVLDPDEPEWSSVAAGQFETVQDLLGWVEKVRPDLVVTYRNLKNRARRWPYSLGVHLDVLTQVTDAPVMVVPDPREVGELELAPEGTREVMVVTDHLTGSHHLVNYGIHFTRDGGSLLLTHLEDNATFDRYVDAIGKIPAIETEVARDEIQKRLLKDPTDYIHACREVVARERLPIEVHEVVRMGHLVSDYRRLVEEYEVDLLVMSTKDEDQLAMHGVAYPLAIELRHIPLLML